MPGAVSDSTDRELDKQNYLPSKCFCSGEGDGPVSKRGCQLVIWCWGEELSRPGKGLLGSGGAGLGGAIRGGLTEKVTCGQRFEEGIGRSGTGTWGRVFQGERAVFAKACSAVEAWLL